jgi:hypothetical protein
VIALGVRRGCIFTYSFIHSQPFIYQCEVINTFY